MNKTAELVNLRHITTRRVSKDFTKDKTSESSLNDTIYNFQVGHSAIVKQDISNSHDYLMIKNDTR